MLHTVAPQTDHIVVFGSGPLPCDDHLPVMAPGTRTWQIALTVATALGERATESSIPCQVTIIGLEATQRPEGKREFAFAGCPIQYIPMDYEELSKREKRNHWKDVITPHPKAVVGCSSIQPCATAASFAQKHHLPLWEDIFGDPIAEIQSKAEIATEEREINENRYSHVWRLLLQCLIHGDRFSGLSQRQTYALKGQLGCAGRLNRHTVTPNWIHNIPYGLFPQDFPKIPTIENRAATKTIMWCGSFNTWMDEKTFAQGIIAALKQEPSLSLMIVGGKIPDYNEVSYAESISAFSAASILAERIIPHDWQSLKNTRALYARCDAGLSIDRYTVEAELGSRTRLVNFLAAGLPVVSTVITELTEILHDANLLFPYRVGDPNDMARALVATAQHENLNKLGLCGRDFVAQHFNAGNIGQPLMEWAIRPTFATDKATSSANSDNELLKHWQRLIMQ